MSLKPGHVVASLAAIGIIGVGGMAWAAAQEAPPSTTTPPTTAPPEDDAPAPDGDRDHGRDHNCPDRDGRGSDSDASVLTEL